MSDTLETGLPSDHPLRLALAAEAHARPPEPVRAPACARYIAVLVAAEDRAREIEHLGALCAAHGVAGPAAGATHHRAALGALRLKWERHGEFSGYTWIAPRAGAALFAAHAAAQLPASWLAAIPGHTVAAVDVELVAAGDPALAGSAAAAAAAPAEPFEGQLIGGDIAEGAAGVATDFRLHAGCTRFLLVDRHLTERQAGRMLQRLFEIEAYRILALLALPLARELAPRVLAVESALARLTAEIARGGAVADDEALLHELSRLAAEVESGLAASQYRFGACEAYCGLVMRRIAELRETRVPSQPTIEEFMTRRFTPAVATCRSVQQRLAGLSERVARASALLATRVGIARERQSQELLRSMDQRARLQLRLQQTVEGLSIAAIAYYVSSLFGHLVEAADAAGWFHVDAAIAVGVALPVIVLAVVLVLRRARRHFEGEAAP